MTWVELKKKVYNEDGALRDIYIRDVTADDWRCWVNHINSRHRAYFEVGGVSKSDKIDFEAILDYWQNPQQEYLSASIHLGEILIRVYFNDKTEIENDINPREIRSIEDHQRLLSFLKGISIAVGKTVELTMEYYQDPIEKLMIVEGDQVSFPSNT